MYVINNNNVYGKYVLNGEIRTRWEHNTCFVPNIRITLWTNEKWLSCGSNTLLIQFRRRQSWQAARDPNRPPAPRQRRCWGGRHPISSSLTLMAGRCSQSGPPELALEPWPPWRDWRLKEDARDPELFRLSSRPITPAGRGGMEERVEEREEAKEGWKESWKAASATQFSGFS